jgi:hypothetical protein
MSSTAQYRYTHCSQAVPHTHTHNSAQVHWTFFSPRMLRTLLPVTHSPYPTIYLSHLPYIKPSSCRTFPTPNHLPVTSPYFKPSSCRTFPTPNHLRSPPLPGSMHCAAAQCSIESSPLPHVC